MPESSTDSPKSKAGFGFNAKSREASALASGYAAEQVTRINKETRIALKRVISESIRDGIPPRDAAKQIREMVGLNRPQALALKRYVRKLSPTLSTAAKAKAGKKLKDKMIRRRAVTIARTEVIDSLTAGVEAAWGQAQDQGLLGKNAKKEWMATPGFACNICQALNGQQVLISKQFISSTVGALDRPTAHPNCRCGIAPVPGASDLFTREGMEVETQWRHAVGTDKSGNPIYSVARLKLHDDILEKTLKGATPVKNPEVVVLGGGPASGKTAAKVASKKRFRGNVAAVDPDEIRTMLPEYDELLKRKSLHAASITHEEASALAKRIMKEGQRRNLNMIADGTGDSSYESLAKKVAGYRKNGATRVVGNYVSIDTDEAMRRMVMRAKKSGRWVPEKVLRGTHASVSRIVPRAIREDLFDSFTLWDNNALGKAAQVVARWSKGKKLEIVDDRKWRSFLAKGDEGLETVAKKAKWPLLDTDTRKVSAAEANKVKQYYTKYDDNLPKTTRRNLVTYTGDGYREINKKLWANPDQLTDRAKSIQRAADNAPTPPPPELVWRGVNGTVMDGKEAGDVFELNGFQSTTINPFTGGYFRKQASGDGILLEIMPSKGLYLGKLSQYAEEAEFLLPHKAKYRIVGRKKVKLESSNGKYRDVLDVLQVQMLP